MKKLFYIFAAAVAMTLASCDQYDGDERFEEITGENGSTGGDTGESFTRRILVEDFTGQGCPNCPSGTSLLNQLKEEIYGDRMITVAMHAGGMSLNYSLHSDIAEEYLGVFNFSSFPALAINKRTAVEEKRENWPARISQEAADETADMDITMASTLNGRELEVLYSVDFCNDVTDSLGVQIYLIENDIIDYQLDEQHHNEQYQHNHVFRMSLNDVWGKTLKGESGEIRYLKGEKYYGSTAKVTIPEDYNIDNCALVGYVFTYSDDETKHIEEVLNTNEAHL